MSHSGVACIHQTELRFRTSIWRISSLVLRGCRSSAVSPPGPITQLPEIVEKQARRIITCPSWSVAYGVVGAVAYCPLSGRRGAANSVADANRKPPHARARGCTGRGRTRTARAHGALDRFAVDVPKTVVTQFELAARADFEWVVSQHDHYWVVQKYAPEDVPAATGETVTVEPASA